MSVCLDLCALSALGTGSPSLTVVKIYFHGFIFSSLLPPDCVAEIRWFVSLFALSPR